MEYLADIDWLTVVFSSSFPDFRIESVPDLFRWKPRSGAYGYNRGQLDDTSGMSRFTSTDRPEMGTCYVIPARALAMLAELHGSASYLFAALQTGFDLARATRLDVRVDIPDGGASAHVLLQAVNENRVVASTRKIYVYQGLKNDEGCTVYFGAKSSQAFLRCYDKNAESHGAMPYTRIEAQLRHSKAEQAWLALSAAQDQAAWSQVIKGVILTLVSVFGVPVIDDAFSAAAPFRWKTPEKLESDTERWLIRQVLPSLVRDYLAYGEPRLLGRLIGEFWKRVGRE